MRLILAVVLLAASVAAATEDRPPAPSFENGGPVETTEGHATLSWVVPEAARGEVTFRLEESEDGQFGDPLVRYEGPDQAVFVSGLHQGTTYYRVRARRADGTEGPWSQRLEVRTDYPHAGRVKILMLVGAVVFLATVGAVVVGHVLHGRQGT